MAKDKPAKEKKEKKSSSSSKNGDDGIKKSSKKDRKSKVNGDAVAAVIDAPPAAVAEGKENTAPEDMEVDVVVKTKNNEPKPIGALVPFARPLADDKVAKKVLKSVKKAAKHKTLKRGVKEVVKALRKSPLAGAGEVATAHVVVLAADISPMDVISHIPVLCEDHGVPYIFVTSRAELGAAGNTKRPTSVVMVGEKRGGGGGKKGAEAADKDVEGEEEFKEVYKDLVKVVQREARTVRV